MYYLCLTQTVNANSLKTKRYSLIIKEMCVLGCHLGWVNMRFCIQKGGSQSHGNKKCDEEEEAERQNFGCDMVVCNFFDIYMFI